jgi:hypothetical protein
LGAERQAGDLFAIVVEAGEIAVGIRAAVGRIDRVGIDVDDRGFAQVGVGDADVEIGSVPFWVLPYSPVSMMPSTTGVLNWAFRGMLQAARKTAADATRDMAVRDMVVMGPSDLGRV